MSSDWCCCSSSFWQSPIVHKLALYPLLVSFVHDNRVLEIVGIVAIRISLAALLVDKSDPPTGLRGIKLMIGLEFGTWSETTRVNSANSCASWRESLTPCIKVTWRMTNGFSCVDKAWFKPARNSSMEYLVVGTNCFRMTPVTEWTNQAITQGAFASSGNAPGEGPAVYTVTREGLNENNQETI